MAKRGRSQKKDNNTAAKKRSLREYAEPPDIDDDIDTFHKQRDIIPLDVDADVDELSDDEELPVFDEGINDVDGNEDDEDGDNLDKGLAGKISRQLKYLRSKYGQSDDELDDDEEHYEDSKNWGGKRSQYYGGTRNLEEDSGEEAEEEEIVRELQGERAKHLLPEDFGMEDELEADGNRELTFEEISVEGISTTKGTSGNESEDRKDTSILSRKEKMDDVHSSSPELVGLLSELNDALEQLKTRVNPLLNKVKAGEIMLDGGIGYLEVKQLLLLAYCQAIAFYLLLKSEGQPVLDHPVISRLVEIKSLLDKMNQLDENIPLEFGDFLKETHGPEMMEKLVVEHNGPVLTSGPVTEVHNMSLISADMKRLTESHGTDKSGQLESLTDHEVKEGTCKNKDNKVGVQSSGMLKLRDGLVEKLKEKGVFSSLASKADKSHKHSKPPNRQLETHDDFNDDAIDVERGNRRLSNGHTSSLHLNKLSQLFAPGLNKPKFVSGDDDLPKRDDIGERRRKHELRVLSSAGIKSDDDVGNEDTPNAVGDLASEDDTAASDDDFYKQAEQNRAVKLANKAKIYTRTSTIPSLPETVDGKRHITPQIEKNKGLTRQRNKMKKNPRKNNRLKHDKANKRRKGQVRDIKKPLGPYGGESTGINTRISRSIRLQN